MPTSYKYIDHERASSRRNWRQRIALLLVLLLFLTICVYSLYFFQVRNTDELILTGHYAEATRKLDHWRWLPLVNSRVYERLGTAKLLEQGSASASQLFQVAESKPFPRHPSIWQEVLKILWTNGRYGDGAFFAAHLQKTLSDQPVLHYYKAGFFTGLNQLDTASQELKAAGNIPEFSKELALLKNEIDQRTNTGQYALLFDRENLAVVNRSMKGDAIFLADSIAPVLRNSTYDLISKFMSGQNQAVLTIDYRIQNAALKALGKYAGAIVVLDINKGDILAAAGSLKGTNSSYPADTQLALTQQYEPGSIVKMITLSGGLEKGVDFSKIFPVQCEGYLKLSQNQILYDWKKHDQVKDINQATAVSCNVTFAKIGLAIKPADLLANLRQFGFNSRLQNGLLDLNLGKIVDTDFNELYVSNVSIGLQHLTMTPLHAAMLASAIAHGGTVVAPRLLLNYRNVIGIPFGNTPVTEFSAFESGKSAAIVARAMQEVVTNPDGTGRRAAIQGFPFAMKTGTAGEAASGYNAIVIGFGPTPQPKIAFAIVLEHAGKAEFEGARVTKLFLESIQGYI